MLVERSRSAVARIAAGSLLAVFLVASAAAQQPADIATSQPPNLGDLKQQLLEYKQSGAYDRDLAAVAAAAQEHVEKRAGEVPKPALVLDIDETSLSNWPQMVANDFGYIPHGPCRRMPTGPCGITSWEMSARAKAIEPTLKLYKAARQKGVSVFFITGRRENQRATTAANLRRAGYHGWTGLILRPIGPKTASAADYKSAERAKIESRGYTIIANVGDQPSDLAGGHAERTFLLPDPFYRIP